MAAPDDLPRTPLSQLRPPPGPRTVILVVDGLVDPESIPVVCERVRRLLERGDVDVVTCDVGALGPPDPVALDCLSRLQLTARRMGRSIRLRHASGDLRDLLALTGLGEILFLSADHSD